MKKRTILFRLELKRMLQTIPAMIVGMVLFAALIVGLTMVSYGVQKGMNKDNSTYQVAIVQQEKNKYTDLAIRTVESMEVIQKQFRFVNVEQEEGLAGLRAGRYDIVFVIPEHFVYDIMYGNDTQIKIYYGDTQGTVVRYMVTELSDIAASYVAESEKSIFAMKDYLRDHGIAKENEADVALSMQYATRILARNNIFQTESVTPTDNISTDIYYYCVGLILVFLFLGLQGAKLLSGDGKEFYRKLAVAKVGSGTQILAKYAALLLCFSLLYGIVTAVVGIVRSDLFVGTVRAWLILMPVCALLMLIFELVENTANAILTLFVVILTLGFVSGFFFPLAMLPQALDVVSKFTVTRAMLEYTKGCMLKNEVLMSLLQMLGHGVVFLGLTIWIRKRRIKKI